MSLASSGGTQGGARSQLLARFYRPAQFLIDLATLVAAFALAYSLRFDFAIPAAEVRHALVQLPAVLLLQVAAAVATGIYTFVWRYVGLKELGAFVRAAIWTALPLALLRYGLTERFQEWRIPASIILMDAALAFGGLLAVRVARRLLYERSERRRRAETRRGARRPRRTLLIGAGRAGVMAVREVQNRGDLGLELVGFVDDDPAKQASVIQGLRVLGTSAQLPHLVAEQGIDQVVITIAEADRETIRGLVRACEQLGTEVQIIPGLFEILDRRVSVSRFRKVQIEDLLGRETVRLDEEQLHRFLSGRSVLITGAGGSIGSELARQAARFRPARLVLVERAENALFEIEQDLLRLWPSLDLVPRLGDVADLPRMRSIFASTLPDVILHAAAHKHVPMMEVNAVEAVKNNALATASLCRLAGEHGVDSFVLISTDKAVRPSSVMGASKRLAEIVVQRQAEAYPDTRFVTVRFGNVLGSNGSVVPIFERQIADGGPVTVTHPDASRYFMTIPEAAQLVLQAGAIGDDGAILILDMGEPVRILDLAEDMIRLSGLEPYRDVAIEFTGLRPGEKLSEELQFEGESLSPTQHPKILAGRLARPPAALLEPALAELSDLVASDSELGVRRLLGRMLPESRLERVLSVVVGDSADADPAAPEVPLQRASRI